VVTLVADKLETVVLRGLLWDSRLTAYIRQLEKPVQIILQDLQPQFCRS